MGKIYSNVDALRAGTSFSFEGTEYIKLSPKMERPVLCECGTRFLGTEVVEHTAYRGGKPRIEPPQDRERASRIAGAIRAGRMTQCCTHGCVHCDFIGWVGEQRSDDFGDYYSTGQFARMRKCSVMTINRRCNEGRLLYFRLGSSYKFILGERHVVFKNGHGPATPRQHAHTS